MNVFFIADLHIGHKNILKFSPVRYGENISQHDQWLVTQWNSVVRSPKDLVWVLGDVCFRKPQMYLLRHMNGRKKLIRGNHDKFSSQLYLEYFEDIYGITKQYHHWLTHAPLHPESLRDKINIHGHVHNRSILDKRYVNVCVEKLNGVPLSLEQLKCLLI